MFFWLVPKWKITSTKRCWDNEWYMKDYEHFAISWNEGGNDILNIYILNYDIKVRMWRMEEAFHLVVKKRTILEWVDMRTLWTFWADKGFRTVWAFLWGHCDLQLIIGVFDTTQCTNIGIYILIWGQWLIFYISNDYIYRFIQVLFYV